MPRPGGPRGSRIRGRASKKTVSNTGKDKRRKGQKIAGKGPDMHAVKSRMKALQYQRNKEIKTLKPLLNKLNPKERKEILNRLKLGIQNIHNFTEAQKEQYMNLQEIQNLIKKLEKM